MIDYKFKNKSLIKTALTHSSVNKKYNNEKLEFLGDRVLGLVVADLLYKTFPSETEGDLAQRHAALVCADTLKIIADEINLSSDIVLAAGEKDIALNKNILADAMEAVIGAVYLDGEYQAAYGFIENLWKDKITEFKTPPRDAKSALQEYTQDIYEKLPTYEVLSVSGSDHAPVFEVAVSIEEYLEKAEGRSKKEAEHTAAEKLLTHLINLKK